MPRYLRHASDNLAEVLDHVQNFLAREFRGSVAKTQNPRLQTLTRAQAQPGGSNGAAPAPSGGGSGGVSILSGDVTGQAQNTTVSLLQNVTLTITSPATGSVLTYNGTAIVASNTVGALTLQGDLTLSTHNLVTDTVTGTKIGTVGGAAGQKLGFFAATPIVQPLLATGAAHTVDDVITVLQNLGLCRQT